MLLSIACGDRLCTCAWLGKGRGGSIKLSCCQPCSKSCQLSHAGNRGRRGSRFRGSTQESATRSGTPKRASRPSERSFKTPTATVRSWPTARQALAKRTRHKARPECTSSQCQTRQQTTRCSRPMACCSAAYSRCSRCAPQLGCVFLIASLRCQFIQQVLQVCSSARRVVVRQRTTVIVWHCLLQSAGTPGVALTDSSGGTATLCHPPTP